MPPASTPKSCRKLRPLVALYSTEVCRILTLLQAHASVVSGNKNRMNLNVVKAKPAKPKFKAVATSVKLKNVSTAINVSSSVVHTVAQSLLSIAKTRGKYD